MRVLPSPQQPLSGAVLDLPTLAPTLDEPKPDWTLPSPGPQASASEPLILVVETNIRLLEQMGRVLTAECWRCALAQDGRLAWRWVGHTQLSLIILDWGLPRGGAARFVSAIQSARAPAVPILVVAPLADAAAVQRAGVDAYLRRPYFAKDLVDMVRTLLT